MNEDGSQAMDDWAEKVAALEPEVADGILSLTRRLAGDKRLRQADRDFAQAQVDAICRAVRRAKRGRKKALRYLIQILDRSSINLYYPTVECR